MQNLALHANFYCFKFNISIICSGPNDSNNKFDHSSTSLFRPVKPTNQGDSNSLSRSESSSEDRLVINEDGKYLLETNEILSNFTSKDLSNSLAHVLDSNPTFLNLMIDLLTTIIYYLKPLQDSINSAAHKMVFNQRRNLTVSSPIVGLIDSSMKFFNDQFVHNNYKKCLFKDLRARIKNLTNKILYFRSRLLGSANSDLHRKSMIIKQQACIDERARLKTYVLKPPYLNEPISIYKRIFKPNTRFNADIPVFIPLFRALYNILQYYNRNLKGIFDQCLIKPPAIEDLPNIYCLDSKIEGENLVIYWIFDWMVYFFIKGVGNNYFYLDSVLLSPEGPVVNAMVLMFCAILKDQKAFLLLSNAELVKNWRKTLADSLYSCNSATNINLVIFDLYSKFDAFSNKEMPLGDALELNKSLLSWDEHVELRELREIIFSFMASQTKLVLISLCKSIELKD